MNSWQKIGDLSHQRIILMRKEYFIQVISNTSIYLHVSAVVSTPLICFSIFILINSLMRASRMMIVAKRKQLIASAKALASQAPKISATKED